MPPRIGCRRGHQRRAAGSCIVRIESPRERISWASSRARNAPRKIDVRRVAPLLSVRLAMRGQLSRLRGGPVAGGAFAVSEVNRRTVQRYGEYAQGRALRPDKRVLEVVDRARAEARERGEMLAR